MSTPFQNAVLQRRSHRNIKRESTLSDAQLQDLVKFALTHSPSSYNTQTTRIVLLLKDAHEKFWETGKKGAAETQEGSHLENTLNRLTLFQSGYGTILFFEDTQLVESKPDESKAIWVEMQAHGAGIIHYVLWTALAEAGMGASLQHFSNKLTLEYIKSEFQVPDTWRLVAQMPFGVVKDGVVLPVKTVMSMEERLKVFGA
ncbi:nitroreductase [Chytriomyces sp. MP71]|nr:nitroreductase [Chytriomyces sp. MP71]